MDLTRLLEPRSVAVVGATDRPDSYADTVLGNLDRLGFSGSVWGIHPRRESVHGRACVPTVADLPEPVDAVVVAIPAASVPDTLTQAAARGCGGAVVLSAGFGEVEEGLELERELREAAIAGDLPVCGPNGNGVLALRSNAPLWGDSVPQLEAGGVAMVSQSGNVAVNALGSSRGMRFHTVVSTGNQAVLDASDWLGALSGLEGVRSVAMFLESDGDGAELAEALASCAERGVGVALLKVGASRAGARAAAAHTGSLAGDHRAFRALVEEAGAAWACDAHELLELAKALAEARARPRASGPAADERPEAPGVAVLGFSGGDSGVAADEAQRAGLRLPELGGATRRRLVELLPPAATIANPLDYTSMLWADTDALRDVIAAVGADPAVEQLLLLYDHPHGLAPASEAGSGAVRSAIVAGATESDAAVLVASTLPELLDHEVGLELGRRGIPAVAGLRTALRCVAALGRPSGDPHRLASVASAARGTHGNRDGGTGAPVDEIDAKAMLAAAGLEVPRGGEVSSEDEAVALAAGIGYPVALKLAGPAIAHKSDIDALALGLRGPDEVRESCRRLAASPAATGARMLLERMVPAGVEVVVAARADAVVPVLVVGLGGIWAEVLDDVAVVPLPASPERALAALHGLRGAPLLMGGRGGRAVDLLAVARLASETGRLLLDEGLDLLELNPVVAVEDGCIAVDAVGSRAPGGAGAGVAATAGARAA
jgi:acetate---CoA ligase (ADP-forming)